MALGPAKNISYTSVYLLSSNVSILFVNATFVLWERTSRNLGVLSGKWIEATGMQGQQAANRLADYLLHPAIMIPGKI